MDIGGNIFALLQVKGKGAKNSIGAVESSWIDCTSILGWLDCQPVTQNIRLLMQRYRRAPTIFYATMLK